MKYIHKTMRVGVLENMDIGAKQDAVSNAVAELQEFYDTRNNTANNMPGEEEDCDADDDVSAESTASEPNRKCRRTETEPESPA